MQIFEIASLADYQAIITFLRNYSTTTTLVIALHGDLGAGKTTFVQQLGQALGVTEPITSPTFTIMARYETPDAQWHTLLHMDAYRIEGLPELTPLHFEELLAESQTVFCIEWAELITDALPPHTMHLTFSCGLNELRTVTLASHEEWQHAR